MKGGNKGVSFNDRELAGDVRRLALDLIKDVLTGKDDKYKKELLLRLAPNLLPRLNEVTGENGGPLNIEISEVIAKKNASKSSTK